MLVEPELSILFVEHRDVLGLPGCIMQMPDDVHPVVLCAAPQIRDRFVVARPAEFVVCEAGRENHRHDTRNQEQDENAATDALRDRRRNPA